MRHALLCLVLLLPGSALAEGEKRPEPLRDLRGITISCQTWGWEWGSEAMDEAMDEVAGLGSNWVAIHPYARIRNDGTVRGFRDDAPPEWLTRPIAEAHRRGLKILIKPHLAYWGSRFSWRGEIEFRSDAEWERFFKGYEVWIAQVARYCAKADAFAVGTELDRTLAHDKRWRQIIKRVRQETKAPLTYAANWTDYRKVGFWDGLDLIGIQAYFPLVNHDRQPTEKELRAGWAKVLPLLLSAYAGEQKRKVLFTELGYDVSSRAALEPWKSGRRGGGGKWAEQTQRLCLEAALAALSGHETVVGAFLWKWFPGSSRGEDFLLSTPANRAVIKKAWKRD